MTFEGVHTAIRWLGAFLAYATLLVILYGIRVNSQRPPGLIMGKTGKWLRSAWFYLVTSVLFFGISCLAWFPISFAGSPQTRAAMLALGSLLYFPGMSFVLWGRLVLGKNYFVSSGFGAQLFAGHQLVTSGPYAIVRHPMYAGLVLAAFGSLLIYSTWTTLFFACFAPFILIRARREEEALAAEFGEKWQEYCQRVPPFFPQVKQ